MYKAVFKTTKEVIYMDDLRSMIKYLSGVLRFHKSHLRGSRTIHETVVISRYNKRWECWEYTGSMYMHYSPNCTSTNWVSLRSFSASCAKWADEREVHA